MNYAIIAAGEGSRLAAEGVSLPKPLVEIEGRPMIGRLIDIFMANHAEHISVIVNAEMKEVAEYVESLRRSGLPITLTIKSTPSSMHSFYEVSRPFGPGRFILTTVDTIFRPEDFAAYVKAFEHAPESLDGMMAVTPFVDDEKPLWVRTDPATGLITEFADTAGTPPCTLVSGGIYGLTAPGALTVLEDCFASGVSRMRNYQRALIAAGQRLQAFSIPKIMDIDHASDLEKARQFLNDQSSTPS